MLVRHDGSRLADHAAIAAWLALDDPGRVPAPEDVEDRVAASEIVHDVVDTLHEQGFGHAVMPTTAAPGNLPRETSLGPFGRKAERLAALRRAVDMLDLPSGGRA